MEPEAITISKPTIVRLARLAFPARVLTALYVLLSVGWLVAAYFDILQAFETQRNRIPYAVVMYVSFVVVFAMAAFRTWLAASALANLRHVAIDDVLQKAVKHTHEMLLIFFLWVILLIGIIVFMIFIPAY